MSDTPAAAAAETPPKIPLLKRVLAMARGGPGLVFWLIALGVVLVVGVMAFMGGVSMGTLRHRKVEQSYVQQTKALRAQLLKLSEEKLASDKAKDEALSHYEAQSRDMALMKSELDQFKMEKNALEKIKAEILALTKGDEKSGKAGGKGDAKPDNKPNCVVGSGRVQTKSDIDCLHLKEVIDAMNGVQSGKPAAVPAPAPAATPSPAAPAHKSH
ncbi:hypothetical protein [Parachitinimonas caeni]|uniref:Uncharacterized protein n=1 Tax=Parachitinimonas caeni TaxID=3031301 RepID=A0ABT7DUM6_9NEIS|nr:hypothetical protein [Parachitinimonas caeni]MDK2123770.1 hypothetical protein [Parachitinimonas caeni]